MAENMNAKDVRIQKAAQRLTRAFRYRIKLYYDKFLQRINNKIDEVNRNSTKWLIYLLIFIFIKVSNNRIDFKHIVSLLIWIKKYNRKLIRYILFKLCLIFLTLKGLIFYLLLSLNLFGYFLFNSFLQFDIINILILSLVRIRFDDF